MPKYIVGIDEVGRGPLAGPVTVGFVAAPEKIYKTNFKGIKDSKQFSRRQREEWFLKLKKDSKLLYGTASVSSSVIDKIGIMSAIRLAVKNVLKKSGLNPKLVLLDGSLYAPKGFKQITIIKGDEKIPIISAASIIAKVTRDRKMIQLAKKFPEYGFDAHKGYGTVAHIANLRKFGLSQIHRKSYCTKFI